MNKKFCGLAIGAMTLGILASCSNEMNEPSMPFNPGNGNGSLLVHAPDITAWSGEFLLGSTGTRAGLPEAPALSQKEIDAVKAYFDAKDNWEPTTGGDDLKISDLSGWKNYYIQNVSLSNPIKNYDTGFGSSWTLLGDNNDQVVNLKVWNIDRSKVLNIVDSEEYNTSDKKVDIKDQLEEPQLVTNHAIEYFTYESEGYTIVGVGNEWVRTNYGPELYSSNLNYTIAKFDQDDVVYIAFYAYNPVSNDNGYWNRIIKLTKVDMPENEESEGEGDVNDGDIIYNDKIMHNNEVEVNLSISDMHEKYGIEDLVSKLSIHVRYPHDVRVLIPVPTEILVPADDLAIVLSHQELLESYGKESRASFKIGDNTVELEVSYTDKVIDCGGHETDNTFIEVTTHGINTEVLKYTLQHYGDGINFEVYNYYQWNVTDPYGFTSRRKPTSDEIAALQTNFLNNSEVEFGYGNWNILPQNECPNYYINAFNNDRTTVEPLGTQVWNDCYVRPAKCTNYYVEPFIGPHLNGSDWNAIYVRDDIKADDAHTEHNVQSSVE